MERIHGRDLLVNDRLDRLQKRHVRIVRHFLNVRLVLRHFLLQLEDAVFRLLRHLVRFIDQVGEHGLEVVDPDEIEGLLPPLMVCLSIKVAVILCLVLVVLPNVRNLVELDLIFCFLNVHITACNFIDLEVLVFRI